MLQPLLIAALFGEALLYVWLAAYLQRAGTTTVHIAATLVLIAMLWRLSHAGVSFCAAAFFRFRDRRVTPLAGSMTALGSEIAARFLSYNWSQPFPGLALGRDPLGGGPGLPILLVHGFFSNRGMWLRFRQRLAAAGIGPVYTITLAPLAGSIDRMEVGLHARIEQICAETGQDKLVVVAHSMGGLVTRAHMAKHGSGRIARFITLGSPHHGTRMAGLALVPCAQQMRYRGAWIEALAAAEARRPPLVPTLSIYTLNDDLVYPPESSVLEWKSAENIPVASIGHVAMLFSAPIVERVIQAIRGGASPAMAQAVAPPR